MPSAGSCGGGQAQGAHRHTPREHTGTLPGSTQAQEGAHRHTPREYAHGPQDSCGVPPPPPSCRGHAKRVPPKPPKRLRSLRSASEAFGASEAPPEGAACGLCPPRDARAGLPDHVTDPRSGGLSPRRESEGTAMSELLGRGGDPLCLNINLPLPPSLSHSLIFFHCAKPPHSG